MKKVGFWVALITIMTGVVLFFSGIISIWILIFICALGLLFQNTCHRISREV